MGVGGEDVPKDVPQPSTTNFSPSKLTIPLTVISNYNQKNQSKKLPLEVRHAFESKTSN